MDDTPELPGAAGLYGLGWYYINGEWSIIPPDKEATPIRCECGTTITMGKEDDPIYHSDYCPVYIAYKAREKKNAITT